MIELVYNFEGQTFRVGEKVRVMTLEELENRYGTSGNAVMLPDGAYDCRRMCKEIGGLELTIAKISDSGEITFSNEDRERYPLHNWYIDVAICNTLEWEDERETEFDDFDAAILSAPSR